MTMREQPVLKVGCHGVRALVIAVINGLRNLKVVLGPGKYSVKRQRDSLDAFAVVAKKRSVKGVDGDDLTSR